jgi:hypothetical protein
VVIRQRSQSISLKNTLSSSWSALRKGSSVAKEGRRSGGRVSATLSDILLFVSSAPIAALVNIIHAAINQEALSSDGGIFKYRNLSSNLGSSASRSSAHHLLVKPPLIGLLAYNRGRSIPIQSHVQLALVMEFCAMDDTLASRRVHANAARLLNVTLKNPWLFAHERHATLSWMPCTRQSACKRPAGLRELDDSERRGGVNSRVGRRGKKRYIHVPFAFSLSDN